MALHSLYTAYIAFIWPVSSLSPLYMALHSLYTAYITSMRGLYSLRCLGALLEQLAL